MQLAEKVQLFATSKSTGALAANNMFMHILLLSSQAAEGETVPAIVVVGRVDVGCSEVKIVCRTNIRGFSS